MLEKTRAIVLHQIKYSDSGIVVQMYTKKFGRQSFLIKGMRNRKAGKHNSLFQPMYILDLELYYKPDREMQTLREFSAYYTPYEIYGNIMKSSVAIFLAEVLTSVLREESPNEELFDFLQESVVFLDSSGDRYSNFHIAFLSGLSSFLGFEPHVRSGNSDVFFDMLNGTFVPVPPVHGNYAGEEIADILARFFSGSYNSAANISLNGKIRNEVLETLIRYYSLHLPGLRRIRSLEVLKEVFS